MIFVAFLVLSILQIFSGLIILPLFLFWRALVSQAPSFPSRFILQIADISFWSLLTGVALGIAFGNMLYWILVMAFSALLMLFLRAYVVFRLTPFILSLFLFMATLLWFGVDPSVYPQEVFLSFFLYAFLFYIFYVAIWEKTNTQRKLF